MTLQTHPVFLYSLIPALAMLLGSLAASIRKPGPKWTSATQHFAAGVVFAAVALELLPKIEGDSWWTIGVGFLLGILVMLGVGALSERLEDEENPKRGLPLGLLTAVGIDNVIDGLLLGIAFLAGTQGGILIAIALTFEILFLGLSVSSTMSERGYGFPARLGWGLLLSLAVPVGALLGYWALSRLPANWEAEFIAFGVAALLFLVTEELLKEAHKKKDTPWITATFFLGFLVILLLKNRI